MSIISKFRKTKASPPEPEKTVESSGLCGLNGTFRIRDKNVVLTGVFTAPRHIISQKLSEANVCVQQRPVSSTHVVVATRNNTIKYIAARGKNIPIITEEVMWELLEREGITRPGGYSY